MERLAPAVDGIVTGMVAMGKMLVVAGLPIAGVRLLWWRGAVRGSPGRRPGDINIVRPHYPFRFPIATGLLASRLIPAGLGPSRR